MRALTLGILLFITGQAQARLGHSCEKKLAMDLSFSNENIVLQPLYIKIE